MQSTLAVLALLAPYWPQNSTEAEAIGVFLKHMYVSLLLKCLNGFTVLVTLYLSKCSETLDPRHDGNLFS